jgi:CheY-like chemotaxis protein
MLAGGQLRAAGSGQRAAGSEKEVPVSRQARILLVDDRSENLVALEAILSSLAAILVPVRSGEQAVQALMDGEYAVVLLDIMMPRMDGFETAAQIRRHARGRDVPIIFLTAATDQPGRAFRSYAAGAVDYLAKPFDPWVLKAKVSVFVDLYLKRSESALDHLGAVEETLALLRDLPRSAAGRRGSRDGGPASRSDPAAARGPGRARRHARLAGSSRRLARTA